MSAKIQIKINRHNAPDEIDSVEEKTTAPTTKATDPIALMDLSPTTNKVDDVGVLEDLVKSCSSYIQEPALISRLCPVTPRASEEISQATIPATS